MPQPKDQRCAQCRYFNDEGKAADEFDECRRYPPRIIQVPADEPGGFSEIGYFPKVSPTDWCGEWQPISKDE